MKKLYRSVEDKKIAGICGGIGNEEGMNFAIFDIDGTLINTNRVDGECYARVTFATPEREEIEEITTQCSPRPGPVQSGISAYLPGF